MGHIILEPIQVMSFEYRNELILNGVPYFRHTASTVGTDKDNGGQIKIKSIQKKTIFP